MKHKAIVLSKPSKKRIVNTESKEIVTFRLEGDLFIPEGEVRIQTEEGEYIVPLKDAYKYGPKIVGDGNIMRGRLSEKEFKEQQEQRPRPDIDKDGALVDDINEQLLEDRVKATQSFF